MSAKPKPKPTPELADDQVAEGVEQVKAALAPKMATGEHIHTDECDHSDEDIAKTVRFVASMAPAAKVGAIDWAALIPLILQILAMFKKGPAPA